MTIQGLRKNSRRQDAPKQIPLTTGLPDHPRAKELVAMSPILDANHTISGLVLKDLTGQCQADTGCPGMAGEQAVRCAVLLRLFDYPYRELAFHLLDSDTARWFSRLLFTSGLCHSTLQSNISKIRPENWEAINLIIVCYAAREKIEQGSYTLMMVGPLRKSVFKER